MCEYSEDIKKYLIDEFNYVCFPASFNVDLELYSSYLNIEKVIGTGYKDTKVSKQDED